MCEFTYLSTVLPLPCWCCSCPLSLPACVCVQPGQVVAVSDYLRVPCSLLFSWLASSPWFPIPSLGSPCSLCGVPLWRKRIEPWAHIVSISELWCDFLCRVRLMCYLLPGMKWGMHLGKDGWSRSRPKRAEMLPSWQIQKWFPSISGV